MNIGSAIKTLRKGKNLSQKDLASKCGISVNALCQIELNETFPRKGTILKICQELNIPTSYLLFFSISEDEIPEEKRKYFNALSGPIRELLLDEIK